MKYAHTRLVMALLRARQRQKYDFADKAVRTARALARTRVQPTINESSLARAILRRGRREEASRSRGTDRRKGRRGNRKATTTLGGKSIDGVLCYRTREGAHFARRRG